MESRLKKALTMREEWPRIRQVERTPKGTKTETLSHYVIYYVYQMRLFAAATVCEY